MKIRFTTRVEPGVVYNPKEFAREVQMYLADPDGWESHGYEFVYVEKNPSVIVHLCTPAQIREAGCPSASLSCAEMGGHHMRLNSALWSGSMRNHSKLPLEEYRQYMVSHEMGHILGHDHAKCPAPGAPAPIMMQQTLGIGACSPNTRVTR